MNFNLAIVDDFVLRITAVPSEEEKNSDLFKSSYIITVVKYQSTTSEDPEILEVLINPSNQEEQLHNLTKDGHYKLDHLILPSVEYAQLNQLSGYCTDGITFYKFFKGLPLVTENGIWIVRSIEELIEINDSSINKQSQETFSISYLHNHYLEVCKNKLYELMGKRCVTEMNNFDMDLVWLSISAIRFNLEFNYLSNAQSIVEDLMRCNNLCYKKNIKITHECKCCH